MHDVYFDKEGRSGWDTKACQQSRPKNCIDGGYCGYSSRTECFRFFFNVLIGKITNHIRFSKNVEGVVFWIPIKKNTLRTMQKLQGARDLALLMVFWWRQLAWRLEWVVYGGSPTYAAQTEGLYLFWFILLSYWLLECLCWQLKCRWVI